MKFPYRSFHVQVNIKVFDIIHYSSFDFTYLTHNHGVCQTRGSKCIRHIQCI